jgi:hypothetical protein
MNSKRTKPEGINYKLLLVKIDKRVGKQEKERKEETERKRKKDLQNTTIPRAQCSTCGKR